MLFKILHGDASRISLDTTPFHEGWCYVTTDGRFYVDMNVGTKEVPDYQRLEVTGKSAYELAVQEGFEGTLTEWLASLKGEQGDDYVLTDDDINYIVNLVSSSFGTRIDNIETAADNANNTNQIQDNTISTIQGELTRQDALITENQNQIVDINTRISNLSHLSIEKVDSLESILNPSPSVIYIIPDSEGDFYKEFIWLVSEDGVTGVFEQIGTTEVDLSNYVTLTVYNTAMATKQQEIDTLETKVTELENKKYYRHNLEIRYRNDNDSLTEAAGIGKFSIQFSIINQNPTSYYFNRYPNKTNGTPMEPEDAWQLYRLFRDLRDNPYPGHKVELVIIKAAGGTALYCFTAGSTLSYGNINCIKTKYYQFSGDNYYTRILQVPFSRLDQVAEFNTSTFEVHCGQLAMGNTTPVIYPDPPADSATAYNADWYTNDYCNAQHGDGADYTKQRITIVDWVETIKF